MNFTDHSKIEGLHAFLGASNYHWINYTDEKLADTYANVQAKQKGTEIHAFAAQAIKLQIKLPANKSTLSLYVNDAIGYKMDPEVVLFYSMNAFGTADAILFRRNMLRIHDLKTGVSPTSMHQLEIYAALFCLEYAKKPHDIEMELRIYQLNEAKCYVPDPNDIQFIMDKIVRSDMIINKCNG